MIIVGFIACGINSSAYMAEIIRSGLQAIDIGQTEAARSLGLNSRQTMRYIIVPQAFKIIVPALGNEFVTLIKRDFDIIGSRYRGNNQTRDTMGVTVVYVIPGIYWRCDSLSYYDADIVKTRCLYREEAGTE